jgi:hypothetical protein
VAMRQRSCAGYGKQGMGFEAEIADHGE